MNYCNKCGADLREHKNASFCWNCGSKLDQRNKSILGHTTYNVHITDSKNTFFENSFSSYGIIFTNLVALTNSLNCSEDEVKSLILNYISQLEKFGHQYVFLDAGNNSYNNISANDGWESHVDLLKSFYIDNSKKAEYLFIIGGHDVVPMAVIVNEPRCYNDDSDIETDMPYSYLASSDFDYLLWNGKIFKESVSLYCGRLPIPADKSVDDFEKYLLRSVNVISDGVSTKSCFGLTAESWERASNMIIKNVNLSKNLYTSPEHNLLTTENIFNSKADIYYFNLHGSDSPSSPEYFGDTSPVINPGHISNAEKDNFLITEACYGAKFIDYGIVESMLLASIYNKTIAFVGSSRVAFGAPSENISSADIVAKSYIENILAGKSCGCSLALARIDVFDACPDDHFDYGTTSAVEFNLFGDPLCSVNSIYKIESKSITTRGTRSKSINKYRPEKKEISINNQEKGLLNDVRNIVNQEIMKIRETISNDLYSKFNIEPRDLSTIFEIKARYGEKTYNYNYTKKSVSGKNQVLSVFTDRTGKIKSIIQSKN